MIAPPPGAAKSHSPPVRTEDHLRRFWMSCGLPAQSWPEALGAYRQYRQLIQSRSAAAGLMGEVSQTDFHLKHVADSLAALLAYPDLLRRAARLADVGSGAGLPGIVLAVALPQLRVTAIESTQKKAAFVADAAAELGLAGRFEVVARRSRELGNDERYRHRFDVVAARAVAATEKLIRDCRLLIAPGGSAIFYKTPAALDAELRLAQREARKHKLALESSNVIELPAGAGKRQFIRIIAPPAA